MDKHLIAFMVLVGILLLVAVVQEALADYRAVREARKLLQKPVAKGRDFGGTL